MVPHFRPSGTGASVLGPDVHVHQRYGGFAGHGDVVRHRAAPGHLPLDTDPVQGPAVEPPDVVGLVGEEIARVLVPLPPSADHARRPVGDPAAVGVHQPADQLPGVGLDDLLLPAGQLDGPLMLLAGAVLGEETPQVLGVHLHVVAPLLPGLADGVVGEHPPHRRLARGHQTGPDVRAGHHEAGHPVPGVLHDVAVPEVEAQQIGVGLPVERAALAAGAQSAPPVAPG